MVIPLFGTASHGESPAVVAVNREDQSQITDQLQATTSLHNRIHGIKHATGISLLGTLKSQTFWNSVP